MDTRKNLVAGRIVAILAIFATPYANMHSWEIVMTGLFGLPVLTYWQTFALRAFVKVFSGRSYASHKEFNSGDLFGNNIIYLLAPFIIWGIAYLAV